MSLLFIRWHKFDLQSQIIQNRPQWQFPYLTEYVWPILTVHVCLEYFLLWTCWCWDDSVTSPHWSVDRASLLWWLQICRIQGSGERTGIYLLSWQIKSLNIYIPPDIHCFSLWSKAWFFGLPGSWVPCSWSQGDIVQSNISFICNICIVIRLASAI